jgi:hypothetical protein
MSTDQDRKVKALKDVVKDLKTAQEDLRLVRARYNKAISDLVDGEQ